MPRKISKKLKKKKLIKSRKLLNKLKGGASTSAAAAAAAAASYPVLPPTPPASQPSPPPTPTTPTTPLSKSDSLPDLDYARGQSAFNSFVRSTPNAEREIISKHPAIVPPPGLDSSLKMIGNITQITDSEKKWLGIRDEGKCKMIQEYEVLNDIDVYRVFNSKTDPRFSVFGDWWSFEKPDGPIDEYRKKYIICKEWSPLDKIATAKLKRGSTIYLCDGQSAECDPKSSSGESWHATTDWPASETQQVVIPNPKTNLKDVKIIGDFRPYFYDPIQHTPVFP